MIGYSYYELHISILGYTDFISVIDKQNAGTNNMITENELQTTNLKYNYLNTNSGI